MMKESTPSDVQEHLGIDPWQEQRLAPELSEEFRRVLAARKAIDELSESGERGVVTIPIVGEDE